MHNAVSPSVANLTHSVRLAKRELVLLAARNEFVDKGLEGATMRGIALRAGCTTGAIYPLFPSKESLYATLLEQSLRELDLQVSSSCMAARSASAEVESACRAFVAYYAGKPFEVNLGLYAFRGLKPQGLGKAFDAELNAALTSVLSRIAAPLSRCSGIAPSDVQPLVTLLFSQMIGALVLQLSGRIDEQASNASALLELMLKRLSLRSARASKADAPPRSARGVAAISPSKKVVRRHSNGSN